MALPTNLAAKIKAIPMDPTVLATDLELAYLLSFVQHSTYPSIQTFLTTRYTHTLVSPTNPLSSTTNSRISTKVPTRSCSTKPPRTINSRISKSSRASDVVSKNSMRELLPTPTILLLNTWLGKRTQRRKNLH